MNFGEALEKLKQGKKVCRKGWNGKGIFIELQVPDVNSIIDKFTNIYIDDFLVNSSEIAKSTKRKLLYQIIKRKAD